MSKSYIKTGFALMVVSLSLAIPVQAQVRTAKPKSIPIDAQVIPFQKTYEGLEYLRIHKHFPLYRDANGYPPPVNVYSDPELLKKYQKKKGGAFFNLFKPKEAHASDPGLLPGEVNCRANTSVTGYFKAFFEDVALNLNDGYNHPTLGSQRRDGACLALQNVATLIQLDQTTVTPDILFTKHTTPMPSNALASASAFYGSTQSASMTDNGTLHRHIISRVDPTPELGSFDAMINTKWNGVAVWSVDSTMNASTFNFDSVMTHELLHAMGFMSLIPSSISGSGQPALHNTFNEFSFEKSPNTSSNQYFSFTQVLSPTLQVPNGTPSSWFLNNLGVYQGIKNVVGAVADGVHPLYTPTSWQQGSSISHFDMNRASAGTVYVMHPSIGPGDTRAIHQHEKEVLCHLGYEVTGIAGCDDPSPMAQDDFAPINIFSGGTCVKFLLNDSSHHPSGLADLALHDLQVVSLPAGSTVLYDTASTNCSTPVASMSTSPANAKSMYITGTQPSALKYRLRKISNNRISQTASILTAGCGAQPNEYVCNGNFEQGYFPVASSFFIGTMGNALFVYNKIPFWDSAGSSPDFVFKNIPGVPAGVCNLPYTVTAGSGPMTTNMVDSGSYAGVIYFFGNSDNERLHTRLNTPLTIGDEYILSMDVNVVGVSIAYPGNVSVPREIRANLKTTSMSTSATGLGLIAGSTEVLHASLLPNYNVANSAWVHLTQTFTATQAFEYLAIHQDPIAGTYPVIIDNVSIKKAPGNTIKGVVYHDVNGNGARDLGEPGLGGIPVSIFNASNATNPFVTNAVTSTNPATMGEYEFTNLPTFAGSYFVALASEASFVNITQPLANNSLINHQYARTVPMSNPGVVTNQNFGVRLTGDTLNLNVIAGCGTTPGMILLQVTGIPAPYTVAWTGPNGYTATTANIYNLQPGTYQVNVTGANGVVTTGSAAVPAPFPLNINATITPATPLAYNNGAISLTITGQPGNYAVHWSKQGGGFSSTSLNISGLTFGTYILDVVTPTGCKARKSYIVPKKNKLSPGVLSQ